MLLNFLVLTIFKNKLFSSNEYKDILNKQKTNYYSFNYLDN